ncbi:MULTISPECIES: hypothetical protein [Stenotrophomonas]|uniref:hypothetical protein n=1 Tax=Stenotrophomonas TaxID=40323 RepID=UPI000B6F146D|nr:MULTISPECIES: hypothetical protein [Stenotrophomonas]SMR76513.1 hypothetical protein SAMN04487863_2194 [Stenotrophomonas sp. yr243]SNS70968.1 hypothetical protein SAMN05518671_1664 [Stenotrophomonas lactitubi]
MRSSVFLALALAVSGGAALVDTADAQAAREVRKQAEASMTLSGFTDIGREGQVEGFQLDHREKVDAGIAGFEDNAVQDWRFEPVLVDGKPVQARTTVRLRLMADNPVEGSMRVRLVDANFSKVGGERETGEESLVAGTDLLPEGGVYMVGRAQEGPRLLTPLG